MKKKLLVVTLLVLLVFSFTACKGPDKVDVTEANNPTQVTEAKQDATEATEAVQPDTEPEQKSFTLEVRKFNGVDANYVANIDGEVLATLIVPIEDSYITVSDALSAIAPAVDGVHKIMFGEQDYICFTETVSGFTVSWFLDNGHFNAEPNYTAGDFSWSYMSYNDHYSNGVTADFIDGLTTYVIVIDGYDGNVGTDPQW